MRGLVLIPDWKRAWKFAPIQIQIPHTQYIAMVLFGLSLIGRVLKLKDKEDGVE